MENSISINVSPIQLLISLAFQIWIIVFPIILIRKLNYLIYLMQDKDYSDKEKT